MGLGPFLFCFVFFTALCVLPVLCSRFDLIAFPTQTSEGEIKHCTCGPASGFILIIKYYDLADFHKKSKMIKYLPMPKQTFQTHKSLGFISLYFFFPLSLELHFWANLYASLCYKYDPIKHNKKEKNRRNCLFFPDVVLWLTCVGHISHFYLNYIVEWNILEVAQSSSNKS